MALTGSCVTPGRDKEGTCQAPPFSSYVSPERSGVETLADTKGVRGWHPRDAGKVPAMRWVGLDDARVFACDPGRISPIPG